MFLYNHDTSRIDNLHYNEYNEDTPWKLYIPLVRSGGYRLTPNPGEGPKEDINSQLDLLHMYDEQIWSLTKVQIFIFFLRISKTSNADKHTGCRISI